jgi:hypothetical protein
MLAGGMTIAAPSMMPQAAAAGALYVSAENAMFGNTFGGGQVIEVVVINHQNETDEDQGEPVVKVDENQLRMVQAVDGNWYAYFGDSTAIAAADESSYLDYGTSTGTVAVTEGDFTEAAEVYKNNTAGDTNTVTTNAPSLSNYNNTKTTDSVDAKFGIGQIGLAEADWPIIQVYDLTIENFDVVYEQAGVHVIYQNITVSGNYLVGYSLAGAADPGSIDISASLNGTVTACNSTSGTPDVSHDASARPVLGSTINLVTSNAPLTAVGGLSILSVSPIVGGLELTFFGMPGCYVYQQLDVVTSLVVIGGNASTSLAIPNTASLVGADVFSQSVALVPGINAASMVSSNGLGLSLGDI